MGGREGPVEGGIAVDVSADPGTKLVVQTIISVKSPEEREQ